MYKLLLVLFASLTSVGLAESYHITVLVKSTAAPYWDIVRGGVDKARTELKTAGVDLDLKWDGPKSEEDVAGQIRLVQEAVKNHVQGIVIAPCDTNALVPAVKAAADAGIPTCVIDSGLKAAGQISFIATDNYKGGVLGARRIGALLEGKGKAVLLHAQKGAGATEAREQGFLDTMKSHYPNIQVLTTDRYAGGTYESSEIAAAEVVKQLGKEMDAVFACNDITNHGALHALKTAGLAGKVKLVGFDASPETLEAIKAGEMQGTIVQNPVLMGYLGVKTLVTHLQGKPVEKEIDTGCALVTRDNLEKPAILELLGGKTPSPSP